MNTFDADAREFNPEEPSSLLDTNQATHYFQAIFHQLDPNHRSNLKYRIVTCRKDLLKQIEDIIDEQRASMITDDFVIIVRDGSCSAELVSDHLKFLKVKHTCLSGPGGCLILTIFTDLHAGATLFFYKSMRELLYRLVFEVWSNVHFELLWAVREKVLKKVVLGQSQEQGPQNCQSVEQCAKQQLQELHQLLKMTLQQQLPTIPGQTTDTMNHILNELLREIYIDSQDQYPQRSSLNTSLQNLLYHLKKDLQEGPQNDFLKLICDEVHPRELVLLYESLTIPLSIHNSYSVCARLFPYKGRDNVRSAKNLDGYYPGSKIPDYSISPAYLSYVRGAQSKPFVPAITVEIGQSDDRIKVLVDCVFTILGTTFQTDAAYAVILNVDKAKMMLNSIDLVHFDVSLKSLVEIRDQLTGKDQASVSLVISQKAQQKANDLRVIELLREWESSGNTGDDEYQDLLDQMAKLRITYSLPCTRAPSSPYEQPSKSAAMDILRIYKRYTSDTLDKERSEYNEIIQRCHRIADTYMDGGRSREKLFCRGEALLVEYIFKRKQMYHIDHNSGPSPLFLTRPFTGVRLMESEYFSIRPVESRETLFQIASEFRKASTDRELRFPLLRDLIRKDHLQEIAMLNYPSLPADKAVVELERAYDASSDGYVELRANICHIDVKGQLGNWGIEPRDCEYENEILLLREYSKRYSKRILSSSSSSSLESSRYQTPSDGVQYETIANTDKPVPSTHGPASQSPSAASIHEAQAHNSVKECFAKKLKRPIVTLKSNWRFSKRGQRSFPRKCPNV
uniref:ARAD1C19910p n=1 Tax=Blastobotrys adeninivorans TaxID=409370 RepID=A0A060T6G7_BLAAD